MKISTVDIKVNILNSSPFIILPQSWHGAVHTHITKRIPRPLQSYLMPPQIRSVFRSYVVWLLMFWEIVWVGNTWPQNNTKVATYVGCLTQRHVQGQSSQHQQYGHLMQRNNIWQWRTDIVFCLDTEQIFLRLGFQTICLDQCQCNSALMNGGVTNLTNWYPKQNDPLPSNPLFVHSSSTGLDINVCPTQQFPCYASANLYAHANPAHQFSP